MFSSSPSTAPLKIAIYRTSSIGDVVLASACVDLLNKLPIPVEITWAGRDPSLKLIKAAFPSIHTVSISREKSAQELSSFASHFAHCHLMIDLQTNLRSHWVGYAVKRNFKIPVVSAHKEQFHRSRLILEARWRGRKRPLPKAALQPPQLQYQMMVDALKKGLRKQLPLEIFASIEGYMPKPHLPSAHDPGGRPWQKELKFGPWLALAPGAAHPAKQVPFKVLAEILSKSIELLAIQAESQDGGKSPGLLIVGDENDRMIATKLLDQISWPGPVLNLAGKLSLWESALALKDTNYLLSNDSSLAHIAEAVGTPVAMMFGPTIEGFGFGPWRPESKAFSTALGCRPCSKHGKIPCRYGDQLCFEELSPVGISGHLVEMLRKPKASHPEPTRYSTENLDPQQNPTINQKEEHHVP